MPPEHVQRRWFPLIILGVVLAAILPLAIALLPGTGMLTGTL